MSSTKQEIGSTEPHLLAEYLNSEGAPKVSTTMMTAAPPPPSNNNGAVPPSPIIPSTTLATSTNGNSTTKHKKKKSRSKLNTFLSFLRTLLLDVPLALLFALFLFVYILHNIHNTIFVPFLEAAARSDDDLDEEFTYYDRTCSAQDLTTFTPSDLILSNTTTPTEAVDTFMAHGGVVFPQILDPDTVQKLRLHVQQRNANLTSLEEIELSQGTNRKSFAFDASEDAIVSQAIKQVASHPQLLPMLEKLIGKDPAVSEITAITSYYNCPDQAWHQDVKADGSPLKFGRTYTHSHSLFIALQDTSAKMGATSMCPGTHYCANDGMADICEEYGFQMSEASPHKVWHAGDAALLSQHVWHRGARHSDPHAPERILFVMTFLARPDLTKDRRQLSRGTYFHMRWNMWGHSFQDLLDAAYSMSKPFSVLRSLGIWKPANRNWGFDLMTSGLLRCANNQQGMTYEELQVFVDNVVAKFRIPDWLQGPVTQEENAWQIYLKETLDKSLVFVAEMNLFVVGPYLVLVLMIALIRRKTSVLTGSLFRLLMTHGVLFLIAHQLLNHIQQSQFASDLRAKRLLMRAFPPVDEETVMVEDGAIMTLPERDDVLVGSRFDARFLGAFDRWLDYHPGNKVFRSAVADSAESYRDYSGLPPVFRDQVVTNVQAATTRRGRFLSQDWRTGLWFAMSDAQARNHVRQCLVAGSSDLLADLNQEIAYMLADYRFGLKRDTALAAASQEYLLHWRNDLLFPRPTTGAKESSSSVVPWPLVTATQPAAFSVETTLEQPTLRAQSQVSSTAAASSKRWLEIPPPPLSFEVGDVVMALDGNRWYRGSIMGKAHGDNKFVVSFEEGDTGRVNAVDIRPLVRIEEGITRVRVDFGPPESWFEGTVTYVHPNREVDVEYDDGDYNEAVPFWKFEVIVDDDE